MSKITLQNVASIDNSLLSAINNNNTTLVAAIDNTLSRDGTSPNPMQAPLDMNSKPILNIPYASTPNQPVALGQITTPPLPVAFPTLAGDVTGTFSTTTGIMTATVGKVNGVSYPTSPSTNTVPVVTGANTITYEAIPNAVLNTVANNTIKSNISGGVATPSDNTLTSILDTVITNARGTLIMRGASTWSAFAPGSINQVLISNGAGADLSWSSSAGGGGGTGTLYTHAAISGGL